MPHTNRIVFNMSHEYIVGWPCMFSMNGTSEDDIAATRFYCDAPGPDVFLLHKCFTSHHGDIISFRRPEMPYDTIAELPGPPFDPYDLPRPVRIETLYLGPSRQSSGISDVRMRFEHTGVVPIGMKAGDKAKLTVMFIGSAG